VPKLSTTAVVSIVAYLVCFGGALYVLAPGGEDAWIEPLFVLGALGIAFPLLALALTRGVIAPPRPSASAAMPAVVAYLALFAFVVLGFAFTAIKTAIPNEPAHSLVVLIVKLVTMVALPAAILSMMTGGTRQWLAPRWSRRLWIPLIGLGIAMFAFQAVFGRGLATLDALHPSAIWLLWGVPACFAWLVLDVGITEEVLFRVAVQSSLADRLRSPTAGVLIGALLFGLAHAPGLYLRGAGSEGMEGQVTVAWAIAYSIAVISPSGILFGVLWARTRSLALVVALHALTDLIPNLAPLLESWGVGR